MKTLLGDFSEFMAGNGIWIVIGVLCAALIVSIVFLILNIIKNNKLNKESAEVITAPSIENTSDIGAPKIIEEKEEIVAVVKQPTEGKSKSTIAKKTENTGIESEKKTAVKKSKTVVEEAPTLIAENKTSTKKSTVSKTASAEKDKINGAYAVTYDKENREWVVKKSGASRASKRCATKAEALEIAEKLSETNNATLRIHKKDGKFQKQ